MVGRQRKAVAVGHKGIAGGFVVDAGAPAHRAAVFRDDQLGVAAVQHLVQCLGQLLLGRVLGLSGGGILPSPGQIGNCIVIVLVAEDIAGKVDIALCGFLQRHVELEVVQERLLIRAVGRKAAGRNLGRSGAADDGLGLAQRAVRAVKAAIVLAAGNDAEAQCLALILLQIQRQAADVVRGGQRQHRFAAVIDDAQVVVVNARVVGRRPADRVEQGIRVVGLAVDAGDGARRADAGQALLNAVIRHSGRADFGGVGCRHTGDLEPDLVIAPAVAAVGQHGIHVDRQGKAVVILCRRQGVLQRNLLLTGHIAVLVRQQAVELDAVGRLFRAHVLLRPVERIGQLIVVRVHLAAVGIFGQRRGFQDIQVQLLEDDLRGRLRGLFSPFLVIGAAHVGEAERRQMGIGIAVLARADDLIAVLPPDFFVGVVCLVRMAGDGCGHFLRRGIPAILHIALAAGDGHRDNEEVGVVRHGIRRQAVQVEGDRRLCHNAFPRGQRDVLAVQRYAVDFVITQIFCQQHDAVGRAAVLAAVALDLRGKAELHGCFKAFRCLAGVGHIVRVAVLFQRAQRQTVLVLAVIAVVVTPLGREIGL